MYTYRGYLGWITDNSTAPRPTAEWPATDIDDGLLADYEASFAMQEKYGLTLTSIWGLAVGRAWPLDIELSIDEQRLEQVRRLLDAAHRHGVRVLAGTGVYSWGFDTIIAANPHLNGGNPHAMCASQPDAWQWMQRVLDFFGDVLQVDGFSFQSADQGRCPCQQCAQWGDVEYHSRLNARVTAYAREKWPEKLVAVNGWGMNYSDPADLPHVVAMTRHTDYLIDTHSTAARRDPAYRRQLIEAIAPCAYGSVGGPFVEPPQHWERTRWFLPCVSRAADHVKALYAEGGRAMEIFFHIEANPGDEVSVRHTAALLMHPDRASHDVLREILKALYEPHSGEALSGLVELFWSADAAYFDRAHDVPASATLSLEPLVSDHAGPPVYLTRHLDEAGLNAYEQDVRSLLKECAYLRQSVGRPEKVDTIAICLRHVLRDIGLARNILTEEALQRA